MVQHWADCDVLEQLPKTGKGTGAPRLFSDSEVDVLRILTSLARYGALTGQLARFAEALRRETPDIPNKGWLIFTPEGAGKGQKYHVRAVDKFELPKEANSFIAVSLG